MSKVLYKSIISYGKILEKSDPWESQYSNVKYILELFDQQTKFGVITMYLLCHQEDYAWLREIFYLMHHLRHLMIAINFFLISF